MGEPRSFAEIASAVVTAAMPLERQLHELGLLQHDPVGYARAWLDFIEPTGSLHLEIDADGTTALLVGSPMDEIIEDRRRRQDALMQHLNDMGHRKAVCDLLETRGIVFDNRPNDPRATTKAIRDYLAAEGRILVRPDGRLDVGGGAPRVYLDGTDDEIAEAFRAYRAFDALRRRRRSARQIKRAARMLGTRTDNGWLVLEARAGSGARS